MHQTVLQYAIVVSIFFSIIPILPQYTKVVPSPMLHPASFLGPLSWVATIAGILEKKMEAIIVYWGYCWPRGRAHGGSISRLERTTVRACFEVSFFQNVGLGNENSGSGIIVRRSIIAVVACSDSRKIQRSAGCNKLSNP